MTSFLRPLSRYALVLGFPILTLLTSSCGASREHDLLTMQRRNERAAPPPPSAADYKMMDRDREGDITLVDDFSARDQKSPDKAARKLEAAQHQAEVLNSQNLLPK